MKEVLAMLLLLASVEGGSVWRDNYHEKWKGPFQPPGQWFQPPGHTFVPPGQSFQPPGPPFPFPGLGLGRRGQQNWHPQQQQPDVLDVSNAEWVCRNMKTSDMIIITAVDGAQTMINGQPLPSGGWPNQSGVSNSNTNPPNTNVNNQGPNNGNVNSANTGTTTPVENTSTPQVNADESSLQHAGEGLIDIRIGAN